MPFETITCDGLPPIKSCSISLSAEEAVRTATLDLVITGDGIPASIGQAVTLKASGEVMLTGYVRDVNPSHDATTRALSVNLVSRSVDYVECSADHPTGEFLKQDLAAIAKALDGQGVGIEVDGAFPQEPRHKVMPGESAFASIERRARGRGILIHDTPKGRIKLATKPEGTHSGGLIFGQNILSGSATFTERGRYSEIKVRGQASEGTEKQQLRPETTARDSGVTRKRVLIVNHEGETTLDRMKKRATWQANRAAGNGSTASITVTGWRDAGGQTWKRNWLVPVDDPWLGLSGMMLIKSVTFDQQDRTTATLELADPRALGGENPRGKTAAGFSAPGAITADYEDE
jgi:prophage tail gpP-like protein